MLLWSLGAKPRRGGMFKENAENHIKLQRSVI